MKINIEKMTPGEKHILLVALREGVAYFHARADQRMAEIEAKQLTRTEGLRSYNENMEAVAVVEEAAEQIRNSLAD